MVNKEKKLPVNLIGISGRMDSEKDAVGIIIQGLNMSLDYDMIIHQVELGIPFEKSSGYEIKKFAKKVNQILSILTGIPIEDFEKEEVKNSYLGEEWKRGIIRGGKDVSNMYPSITVCQAMQLVDTELFRDKFHPNTWVNALFSEYKESIPHWYPSWIITDVKFENQVKAIKDRGGILIRVNRESPLIKIAGDGDPKAEEYVRNRFKEIESISNHSSETELDNYEFDLVVDNNGSIEDLIEKMNEILIEIGII